MGQKDPARLEDRSRSKESAIVEDLMAAAVAGNRGAQEELLRRYWPTIQSVVRARRARLSPGVRNREQTIDMEQEAAVHLLTKLPSHAWRGRRAFAAWVAKLAATRVLDNARFHGAARRQPAAEVTIEGCESPPASLPRPSPESQIDDGRRLAALQERLATLKPEYAAAVVLHHMGYTHAEIGEMLTCSAEAARKLVSRGRMKLV